MRALAPDGCLERHHDPHLVELWPYCQTLEDESISVTARAHNPHLHPIQVDLALVLPAGWSTSRLHRRLTVPPGAVGEATWWVNAGHPPAGTHMLTVDVVFEGEYLGQKAECYVYRRDPSA
jgi:hypothetical protein